MGESRGRSGVTVHEIKFRIVWLLALSFSVAVLAGVYLAIESALS